MASLMPNGKQAYFDSAGAPLAGGKLYTYAAGTSTPLATYSDQAGTTPNTNPVVLDARGEATIFWGSAGYKVSLYDSADALIWTQDNLYVNGTAALDGTALAPSYSFASDTNTGIYRIGADNMGMSLGGTKRWDFGTAGSTLTGTLTVSGAATLQSTLAVTSTLTSGAITAPSLTAAAGSDVTLAAPSGQSAHLSANGGTVGFSVLTGGTNDNKSRRLVNVADPSSAQDAATKAYVDGKFPALSWTALTPTANWTAGAGASAPGYWKDAAGVVHLKGYVTAGAGASNTPFAAASLPAGCRPAGNRHFAAVDYTAGAALHMSVGSDGSVVFGTGLSPVEGHIYAFDAISFVAEQ